MTLIINKNLRNKDVFYTNKKNVKKLLEIEITLNKH